MPRYKRGSGSVYLKRGWCYLKYYVSGKPVYEAARTKNKAEARRLLQARLGQLAEGRYLGPAVERVTFEDLAEMIFDDYRVNDRKTLAWVQRRVHRHLAPLFGGKKAHEISTVDVKAFIVRRKEQGAQNGEINLELSALRRMFNLALRAEKIDRKPYIPMLAETTVRQGFFERGEFEAILPSVAGLSPSAVDLCLSDRMARQKRSAPFDVEPSGPRSRNRPAGSRDDEE